MQDLENALADASTDCTRIENARAKVNLTLHVRSRRPDGYHEIESLAVFTEFGDLLRAVPSPSNTSELAMDGEFAGELDLLSHTQDNLVTRAQAALRRSSDKTSPPLQLSLTKRIPIAAGLGGGSADAAAVLRLLSRLWQLDLGNDRLERIGLELGADVPMCLSSRPVIARGIGERLSPVPTLPDVPLVLVNPRVPLSTAEVFGRLEGDDRTPMADLPTKFSSLIAFVIWLRQTRNDLMKPAKAVSPLVGRAVKALFSDPDCLFARMSGSGATAFGIFAKLSSAERAAERIRLQRPDWWVITTEAKGV